MANTRTSRLSARATEIGEFIHYQSCDRRFKLETNHRAEARRLPFVNRLFNVLDPVLQEMGHERENEWERYLLDQGFQDLTNYASSSSDHREMSWAEFRDSLTSLPFGQVAYGREVSIEAEVGAFLIQGRIDFILVIWDG